MHFVIHLHLPVCLAAAGISAYVNNLHYISKFTLFIIYAVSGFFPGHVMADCCRAKYTFNASLAVTAALRDSS